MLVLALPGIFPASFQKYAWRACLGRVSVSLLTPYFLCTIVGALCTCACICACVPRSVPKRSQRIVFLRCAASFLWYLLRAIKLRICFCMNMAQRRRFFLACTYFLALIFRACACNRTADFSSRSQRAFNCLMRSSRKSISCLDSSISNAS